MTKELKTLGEALEAPFEDYMGFCHHWVARHAHTDPLFLDMYHATQLGSIEANWARRYYMHNSSKLSEQSKNKK